MPQILILFCAGRPWFESLEEIVALIINEDECREILNFNLPYSLHTQLGVFYAFDALDRALLEHCSYTSDGTEVETTMLLTSLGDTI